MHSMTHPGPQALKEMQRKAEQGMNEFRMKSRSLFGERAKVQYDIPTDPQELYECANQ